MTISNSDERLASLEDESDRFYWSWQGLENRSLQVFFYLHAWLGMTDQHKHDWLSFAQQNGEILSSSILQLQDDSCVWTVVKKLEPTSERVVIASKEIRIPGLNEFLSSAVKKPT